jgi:hypothetical protein
MANDLAPSSVAISNQQQKLINQSSVSKPAIQKPKSNSSMDLKQASELVKQKLSDALEKKANATISIEKQTDYWLASVEIIEEEYLPGHNQRSMNDLIALYEVHLSYTGELLKWIRKRAYKRGEIK